jgi:tetratricopeptide (TPR) repeat protein
LLANFVKRYAREHRETFVLPHFIGVGPGSTDMRRILSRLCREIVRRFDFEEQIPDDYQELRQVFRSLLERAATCGSIVLVLDGINQLDESYHAHSLDWLPHALPPGCRFVLSLLEGDCLQVLRHRKPQPIELTVPRIEIEDRREIVRQTLGEFRKRLDESPQNNQLSLLLGKADSDNPLYLTVACEELRVFGAFERVTERIASLSDDTAGLLEQVLERLEHDHGRETVRDALSLLECSRQGLLESDMLELLRREGEEQLPRAIWARLYRGLQFYLRSPGETGEGALDFFHRQLAKAVRKRYLANAEDEAEVHRRLADYFLNKADPRRDRSWTGADAKALKELPHHSLRAGLHERLFELARDQKFLTAQTTTFREEPKISLTTIQDAIRGACAIDNATAMAEFSLAHAQRCEAMNSESPLEALRAGNLDRTWELAGLADSDHSALWHLLLAWELRELDRIDEARATLERLRRRPLSRLSDGYGNRAGLHERFGAELLVRAAEISSEDFADLHQRLMGSDGYQELCERMIDAGHIAAAAELVPRIDSFGRNRAWCVVARAQADAGDFDGALVSARRIDYLGSRAEALCDISAAQARAGHFAAGVATAREIGDEYGEKEKKLNQLRILAKMQAEAGDLRGAIEAATGIEHDVTRDDALRDIAVSLAQSHQFDSALDTVQMIQDEATRAGALVDIALARAAAGDLDQARSEFTFALDLITGALDRITSNTQRRTGQRLIMNSSGRLEDVSDPTSELDEFNSTLAAGREAEPFWKVIEKLAVARAQAGDFASAFETVERLKYDLVKARVLREIAVAQLRAGNPDEARSTFAEALQLDGGSTLNRLTPDEASLVNLSTAVAAAKEKCNPMFLSMRLGDIALAFTKLGDLSAGLSCASNVSDWSERSDLLRKIAAALAEAGDLKRARVVFSEAFGVIQEKTSEPEHVIPSDQLRGKLDACSDDEAKACTAAGDFEAALDVARRMKDERPRAKTMRHISEAQLRAGYSEEARTTLAFVIGAKEETTAKWKEWVSERLRGNIAEGLARAGRITEAIAAVPIGGDRGPSCYVLRSIAEEHLKRSGVEAARSTIRLAVAAAARARERDTLIGLAGAQARGGDLSGALNTVKAIPLRPSTPLRRTLRGLLRGDGARARSQVGREWDQDIALRDLMLLKKSAGEFDLALRIADQISDAGMRAEVLSDIASAMIDAGNGRAATRLLNSAAKRAEKIEDDSHRARVMCEIATAQTRAGERTAARAGFARAVRAAEAGEPAGDSHYYVRSSSLLRIAQAQVNAGEREAAVDTFERAVRMADKIRVAERIEGGIERMDSILSVARAQHEAGLVEAAKATTSVALDSTRRIDGQASQSRALCAIAVAQAKIGDRESALATLAQALECARRIDPEREGNQPGDGYQGKLDLALRRIAVSYAQAGRPADGLSIARMIESVETSDRALEGIALAQAEAGDFPASKATVDSMHNLTSRASTLLKIAQALAKTGEIDAALGAVLQFDALCSAAADELRGLSNPTKERIEVIREIARARATEGNITAARETIDRIDDREARACALHDLAIHQAEAGNLETARATSRDIETEGVSGAALRDTANSQVRAGFRQEAVRLAESILGERARYLMEVAATFADRQDRECFKSLLISCAHYSEAACKVCGLLALVYPDHAASIAQLFYGGQTEMTDSLRANIDSDRRIVGRPPRPWWKRLIGR